MLVFFIMVNFNRAIVGICIGIRMYLRMNLSLRFFTPVLVIIKISFYISIIINKFFPSKRIFKIQ